MMSRRIISSIYSQLARSQSQISSPTGGALTHHSRRVVSDKFQCMVCVFLIATQ